MSVQFVTINEEEGQRIDNFLFSFLKRSLPKSLIYRWISKGDLRVNKKRVKPLYRLKKNDLIRIPPFQDYAQSSPAPKVFNQDHLDFLKKQIIFENEHYLILNKPKKIPVHKGSNCDFGIIERLRLIYLHAKKLELVHRLDKETSGCLIIAKKYQALVELQKLLKDRKIKKIYKAVVHGKLDKGLNVIDFKIKRLDTKVCIRDDGKESRTYISVLKYFTKNNKDYTLISAFPKTGRMHQIRIHLAHLNHFVVGDSKYSPFKNDFSKMLLHAESLEFVDPFSDDLKNFKATDYYIDEFINEKK